MIRSLLSKVNFALGNKPKVVWHNHKDIGKFIPSPYKAVLIISCDFELAWGWRLAKSLGGGPEEVKELARKERENINVILAISEKFNIPITWATVGHLFLKECSRQNGLVHADMPRLRHFENKYWRFKEGDWFGDDPCCSWRDALEWYAPDLIEKIINSKVKHEIACHTFSHINCSGELCPEDVFRKELQKCKKAASAYGIELTSLVFPGNFIGNLNVLKEEGFSSYRADKDILGFPAKDRHGLWQVPTTAEISITPYDWNLDYYIERYRTIIERAVKFKRLCHFWFHPSADKKFLEEILAGLFKYADERREEIYITTMKDYVNFLENKSTDRW